MKEEKLTKKELIGHLRFEPEYLMFQPDNKRGGIVKMMEYLGADIKNVVVFFYESVYTISNKSIHAWGVRYS